MIHPSYLKLDRAALDAGDADTLTHVERCTLCREYVARVSEAAESASVPKWVNAVGSSTSMRKQREAGAPVRLLRRYGAPALLAVAALLGVALYLGPRLSNVGENAPGAGTSSTAFARSSDETGAGEPAGAQDAHRRDANAKPNGAGAQGATGSSNAASSNPERALPVARSAAPNISSNRLSAPEATPDVDNAPMYVASKGTPNAAVYVKRGETVFVWKEGQTIRPGDRLRIQVIPGGYTALTVLTGSASNLTPLYRSEIASPTSLPLAWEVSPEGTSERLVVVLSRAPLSDAELKARVTSDTASRDVWIGDYVLPKDEVEE